MKIHDAGTAGIRSDGVGQSQALEQQGRKGQVGVSGAQAGSGGDEVQLSSLAESVSALDSLSVQRQEKIEQLKAEFEAGKYRADPEAISKALIEEGQGGGV